MEGRHSRQGHRVEPDPVILAQHRHRGPGQRRRHPLLEVRQLLHPGDRAQRPAHVHRNPKPGKSLPLAGRHLPVQPRHRVPGAERLPGQQPPLRFGRSQLPGRQRRFRRDPAPRQLGHRAARPGLGDPHHLQPAGQPVAHERGGQVEQLLGLPERQARVVIRGQVGDLRASARCRHDATSASAASAPRGADIPRATDKTVARGRSQPHGVHRRPALHISPPSNPRKTK
jgi:hypothetical protein